ncbi:MAG: amidophosphoribosyltransferase [Waddliaceae bacterium]
MCGIFGIIGNLPIAESIYHGIIQLQHRGQDAAGIFTYDLTTNKYATHKDLGLVREVFKSDTLPLPNASWGIGHVRYTTIGKGRAEDTQPMYVQKTYTIGMAHNGNVVNYVPLRKELEQQGAVFETSSDIEVILQLFARNLPDEKIEFKHICEAIKKVHEEVVGAYSVVAIIGGKGMVAFRDPKGIRPLLLGYRPEDPAYAFGSETNALTVFGCRKIEDVKPGEVIFVDKDLQMQQQVVTPCCPAHCSFEYNYFSKPNTIIDKHPIYDIRSRLGTFLGEKVKEARLNIDVVIPIPTTARSAAISLAKALGVDYEEGFVKQDHIGRTFIMPTQAVRQEALSRKLSAVPSIFKDKSVILVDDSIVRGTVSKKVVFLSRMAGARKVYFASTFPPIRHPCLYGIDFPHQDQLIAAEKSIANVCDEIGTEGLFYNDVEALKMAIGTDNLCAACLTGKYPTAIDDGEELLSLRQKDLKELELACTN